MELSRKDSSIYITARIGFYLFGGVDFVISGKKLMGRIDKNE
jgi:hypothetical protein